MSKLKRKSNGRFSSRRSPLTVGGCWLAGFVSVSLVYASGRLLLTDLIAFRPCSTNNSGLHLVSCGKRGINLGDLVFLLLFGLAVALSYSLFTAAWRMSRRTPS